MGLYKYINRNWKASYSNVCRCCFATSYYIHSEARNTKKKQKQKRSCTASRKFAAPPTHFPLLSLSPASPPPFQNLASYIPLPLFTPMPSSVVSIGPFCTVGSSAKLGNGCRLNMGSHIYGNTELGERCVLMTQVMNVSLMFGTTMISENIPQSTNLQSQVIEQYVNGLKMFYFPKQETLFSSTWIILPLIMQSGYWK